MVSLAWPSVDRVRALAPDRASGHCLHSSRRLFPGSSRRDLLLLALKCAAIPLLIIGMLWPAGLFKLSLLKKFTASLSTMFWQGSGICTSSLSQLWWTRIASSPVEYLLLSR